MNRDRELRVLDDLRGGSDPRIVVLNGMSGVGKTAIGLHWARANAHRFPGGQLHADLALYRHSGGVAVNDVLAAFLAALGVHEHFIPTRPAERAAMFRSRTAVQPVLVFADNADQAAQVRPLVPGAAGSTVIVTSQNRLSGLTFDDARFVDLSPLSEADSYTLLLSMLPDRLRSSLLFDDVRDVIALCSGLPVAIRIAAARLAERNRWSPETLVAYLSKEDKRLARLSVGGRRMNHVLDTVAAALPNPAGHVYRCLGLHAGPEFGSGVVAAAARLSEDDATDALDQLFEANLVECVAPQRYRLHDLVRLHARGLAHQLLDRDRDSVLSLIESWYLTAMTSADLAVAGQHRWRLPWPACPPRPFTPATAMQWYETERPNLIAIARTAAQRSQDTVVLRLCEALWPFYYGRKHHADWIEAHQLGIASALRLGHRLAEARMRNQLARAYIELNRFADAEVELAHAWQAADSTDEQRAKAVVWESEGVLHLRQGRFGEAAGSFAEALRVNEVIGDQRGTALERYHRADALVRGGTHLTEAVRLLEEAMATAEAIDDETTAAQASIVLGRAHLQTNSLVAARRALERAVETMRRRRQPIKEIQALETLVRVAQRMNDAILATESLERLAILYRETGSPKADAAPGDEP